MIVIIYWDICATLIIAVEFLKKKKNCCGKLPSCVLTWGDLSENGIISNFMLSMRLMSLIVFPCICVSVLTLLAFCPCFSVFVIILVVFWRSFAIYIQFGNCGVVHFLLSPFYVFIVECKNFLLPNCQSVYFMDKQPIHSNYKFRGWNNNDQSHSP